MLHLDLFSQQETNRDSAAELNITSPGLTILTTGKLKTVALDVENDTFKKRR